jgi:disulfide bond formation protein DsbB
MNIEKILGLLTVLIGCYLGIKHLEGKLKLVPFITLLSICAYLIGIPQLPLNLNFDGIAISSSILCLSLLSPIKKIRNAGLALGGTGIGLSLIGFSPYQLINTFLTIILIILAFALILIVLIIIIPFLIFKLLKKEKA